MNTVIFNNSGFYEYDGIDGFYEELGTDNINIVGYLKECDLLQFNQIQNNENYIITIIKEENGEHQTFYVNGLELKINYKSYDSMAHGGLNIWKASDLKCQINV